MRRGGAVSATGTRPRRQRKRPAPRTPEARRPAKPSGPPSPPKYGKPLTTAALIGWTALSALVPGAAHLRAGNRRAGFSLLGALGVLLVAMVAGAVILKDNAGVALRPATLNAIVIGAGAAAIAWFALIIMSYVALKPERLNQAGQIVSGLVAGVLCVSVMAPFALAATTVKTANSFLDDVFSPSDPGAVQTPIKAEDPWGGRKRVNFLLIGGDAAGNRDGVRTDSMTVASVNIATGNTVMFSLPRNLQFVRFPVSSPLHKVFPEGFNPDGQGLLNSVWYYAENNPQVMGGKRRGPLALKDAIGFTLGLHIDYYAMVDMYGFAALIDAIGGLKIRVEQDVKWGGTFGTAGTIKAGYRTLRGEEVLWYGRSRVNSDDFGRMARQRCVIGALAQQATPATVLANFNKIASAARHMFRTDIPRDLLEHLVPLGLKVKNAKITSLQFVPPVIYTGSPDWAKIRRLSTAAIRESMSDRVPLAAAASPSASGAVANPTPSVGATPRLTPTPNKSAKPKAAKTLSELCGF
jgi:polyisoprenyl-teichoic acid--peptidoglycan teichoic acid transferase